MQTYVPSYYQEFTCVATKCQHNCCIGWGIDIDNDTYSNYLNVSGEFKNFLKQNIVGGKNPHFKLAKGGRCPFLNKDNLCDIIINLGEENLCEICKLHPRFINYFENRLEVGLGLCCEEAARIILTNKEKMQLVKTEGEEIPETVEELSFFNLRNKIFIALQDRTNSIDDRIKESLGFFGVEYQEHTRNEIYDIYKPLERLDTSWDIALDRLVSRQTYSLKNFDIIAEQLLTYFVYRHLSEGLNDGLFAEYLQFAVLSYNCIKEICKSYKNIGIEKIIDIARMYSAEVEYSDENLQQILSKI